MLYKLLYIIVKEQETKQREETETMKNKMLETAKKIKKNEKNEPFYFGIDTYKDNCLYKNNATRGSEDYTTEELAILLDGGKLESEWDEDGNVTAYDFISEEE